MKRSRGVLVQRAAETAALESAWAAAVAGRGTAIVIAGPAGIGKTALLEATADQARRSGGFVLGAWCSPISLSSPNVVGRSWFGNLARRNGLGTPPFDGPGARVLDVDVPPAELGYAARWVLDDMAQSKPVLLSVDDLQWADPTSLALVDELSRAVADLPILLVTAVRDGETPGSEHLVRIRRAAARIIEPQALSPESVRTLLGDLPAEVTSAIAERSGGVPFLVHELAVSARTGGGPLPATVVEYVQARLGTLPDGCADVAHAVAVLGDEAPLDLIAEVAGREPTRAAESLDRLVTAGLLVTTDVGHCPSHPLIGEAIRAGAGSAAAIELHRRAARGWQARGADEEIVAQHLLHVPAQGDRATTALFDRLGRKVLSAESPQLAATYFRRAVAEAPPGPSDVDLLRWAARATAAAGDIDEAMGFWRRAAGLVEETDAAAMIMADAGDGLLEAGRFSDVLDLWLHWLQRLDEDPATASGPARKALTVRMALLQQLAPGIRLPLDPNADVQRFVAEILAQPPEHDTQQDRLLLAAASTAVCFTMAAPADFAVSLAERAWGDGALLRAETAKSAPLYLITMALNWADCWDLAVEILDAAADEARRNGWTQALATAAYCRGYVEWRRGSVRAALDDFLLARHLRSFGWSAYAAALLELLIELNAATGDLGAMADARAEMADLHVTEHLLVAFTQFGEGHAELADGEPEAALLWFERTGVTLAVATENPATINWRAARATALAAVGRTDEARASVAEALAHAERWGAPRTVAETLIVGAEVADERDREVLLRRALDLTDGPRYRGLRERYVAAVALAEHLHAGEEALALAGLAHDYAAEEGLLPLQRRAAAVLARSGRAVAGAGAHVLSPSERRVAALAAAGRSNREIAAHLFVTVKAVEWHLSSVYRKLAISGRRELPQALGIEASDGV